MKKTYDVLIVGAGPAGIAAGIELSRAGWEVLLIDKAIFPREKVCGGFIGPENKDVLSRYGVLDEMLSMGAQKVKHIILNAPSGEGIRVPLRHQGRADFGLGFSRKNMDELLLRQAQKLGVSFLSAAVIGNSVYTDGRFFVTLKRTNGLSEKLIHAKHLIYSNGAGQNPRGSKERLFGVSGMFDSCPGMDSDVVMHFIDQGHAGINAFEGEEINVCYVIKEKLFKQCHGKYDLIWKHFIKSSPSLRRQMGSAKLIGKWKGTFIDLDRPSHFFDGQAFFTGDAAGLIHPIAGGGITMALNSGALLGKLMGDHRPNTLPKENIARQYETIWRRSFQRSIGISRLIGSLSHQASVANVLIWCLKASRHTVNTLFDIFHQPSTVLPGRSPYGFNKNS